MPELPEVETVKNSLIDLVLKKKIVSVSVYYENIIQNVSIDDFKKDLSNQTINDIKRVGKYLVFILDDYILLSHLRMEGKYFLKNNEDKSKHEHIIFNLENGETLRYCDTRKFGVMYLFHTIDINDVKKIAPLNHLGIEPLDDLLTLDYLKNKFKKIKKPIKTVLLDQTIISGLGNIYADEVLFLSKLNPLTITNTLSDENIMNIITASKKTISKAIELGGTTIRSFVNSHDASGRFQNELLVHTKTICPVCNNKIEKIFVSKRGTYYCNNCQSMKER